MIIIIYKINIKINNKLYLKCNYSLLKKTINNNKKYNNKLFKNKNQNKNKNKNKKLFKINIKYIIYNIIINYLNK